MLTRNTAQDMHRRVLCGQSLTLDEQRELMNWCINITPHIEVPTEFVGLEPIGLNQRCPECHGTGEWGDDYDWGLMYPLTCTACNGTGHIYLEPPVAEEGNSPLDRLMRNYEPEAF